MRSCDKADEDLDRLLRFVSRASQELADAAGLLDDLEHLLSSLLHEKEEVSLDCIVRLQQFDFLRQVLVEISKVFVLVQHNGSVQIDWSRLKTTMGMASLAERLFPDVPVQAA